MNLIALIEEIDKLEEILAATTDSTKRMLLISQINIKNRELEKLNSIKDT